jgi:hypothetical protein
MAAINAPNVNKPSIEVLDERILILAFTDKDAPLLAETLHRAGLCTKVCDDLAAVSDELQRGAGALILAQEVLPPKELATLVHFVAAATAVV